MGVKVTNNAFGTISAGINSSDTTITLDSGQGARFPTLGGSDHFYGTLVDTSNNVEIVKVTARSTDSMTVTRAQDGTTARAFSIGDRFELRPTAALFEDIYSEAVADATPGTDTITAAMIQANAVGASELNVSGNGTTSQYLRSDGDGTFSWDSPTSNDASALTTGTLPYARLDSGTIVNVSRKVVTGFYTLGTTSGGLSYTTNHDMTITKRITSSNMLVDFGFLVGGFNEMGNSICQWRCGFRSGGHSGTVGNYTFNNMYSSGFHGNTTRFGYNDDNHAMYVNYRAELGNWGGAGTYYMRSWWTNESNCTMEFNRNTNNWSHNGFFAAAPTVITVTEIVA